MLPSPKTLLAAGCLLGIAACATMDAAFRGESDLAGKARAWEHETSDVPVDDRIHFGSFDNGMRYAWANNPEPKDRAYMRLHVNAGSLAEEDDELGMAHFLEHMAFNGSENFPPGTLIEWFQEHGMNFGADTNAYTSFGETVYMLDLPESDAETLREGLQVMRDYAGGLLIEDEEVDAEKGVIDGEQRERDSAGFRMLIEQLDKMFGGTLVAERLPIGEEDVRAEFTGESVRDFYERWYRPENLTLVLVGDLGDLNPEPLFAEAFESLPVPSVPFEEEPELGEPESYSLAFTIHEEEVPTVSVTLAMLEEWEEEPYTKKTLTQDLPLDYARRMLNLRFRELAKQESAPFLNARASSAEAFEIFDGEQVDITCAPDKWSEALVVGEQELRRALQFGFQEAELAEVRADALRGLDEAVEREPTAHSRSLLQRILNAAETRYVPTDAESRRAIFRPAIEALTVEACHEAFVEAWGEGEFTIYAAGNLDLGDEGGEILMAAYEKSAAMEVEAGAEIQVAEFAYPSSAEQLGRVASREHVEDLDFHTVRFENGVAVNVKQTDFKDNELRMSIRLGEGQLTLPASRAALAFVSDSAFNGGGLEAHSEDEIRRLTAGRQVGVGFGTDDDHFSLGGGTTREDLLMQCELACAYLQAPGWREEGMVQLSRQIPLIFEQFKHNHQGPMITEWMPALQGGDVRFGFPSKDAIESVTMEEVREWLGPQLAEAPIEVTFCGDLDVEETIQIAARTFGTLPKRRELRDYPEHRKTTPTQSGVDQTHTVDTEIPKSLVMVAFPTGDGMDVEHRRKVSFLNTIVSDRLRLEVRERLGASYSPFSFADTSEVYPGVGMLMIRAMADPEEVDTLVEACLDVADDLAQNGVTEEEAERLREPILKRRRDSKRQNGYWMSVMAEAQTRPETLDEARSGDAFYESVSARDLTPLAREVMGRDKASVLVVNPGS